MEEKEDAGVLASVVKILRLLSEDVEKSSCDHYLLGELRKLNTLLADVAKLSASKALQLLTKAIKEARAILTHYELESWLEVVNNKKKGGAKKKRVDAKLREEMVHFQKILGLLQLLFLVQSQGKETDGEEKTVLWVDDAPDNNKDEVAFAAKQGINCIQKISTAEAKEFLSANSHLQRCSPARFRIITDIYRPDEGDDAGKNLINHLRSSGWDTPVMIYCSSSISAIELQGSANNVLICDDDSHLFLYFSGMLKSQIVLVEVNETPDEEQKEKPHDALEGEDTLGTVIPETEFTAQEKFSEMSSATELPIDAVLPNDSISEPPVDAAPPQESVTELPVDVAPNDSATELPADTAAPNDSVTELPVDVVPNDSVTEFPVDTMVADDTDEPKAQTAGPDDPTQITPSEAMQIAGPDDPTQLGSEIHEDVDIVGPDDPTQLGDFPEIEINANTAGDEMEIEVKEENEEEQEQTKAMEIEKEADAQVSEKEVAIEINASQTKEKEKESQESVAPKEAQNDEGEEEEEEEILWTSKIKENSVRPSFDTSTDTLKPDESVEGDVDVDVDVGGDIDVDVEIEAAESEVKVSGEVTATNNIKESHVDVEVEELFEELEKGEDEQEKEKEIEKEKQKEEEQEKVEKAVEPEKPKLRVTTGANIEELPDRCLVGIPSTFTLHAVDKEGDEIEVGGDWFSVNISPSDSSAGAFSATVLDNEDGSYTVSFTGTKIGEHSVTINLDGKLLPNGSQRIIFLPGVCDAKHCYIDELIERSEVGTPIELTLIACDAYGNRLIAGGDSFVTNMTGPKVLHPTVTDNDNGTYGISFVPDRAGDYKLSIYMDSTPIRGSPLAFDISEGTTCPEHCVISKEDSAEGGYEGYVVGSVNKFSLISRDRKGNRISRGGDTFFVVLHDAQKEIELDGFVFDNSDGSYTVSYFPTCIPQPSPEYHVSVYLQVPGSTEKEDLEGLCHIAGSPFILRPLEHERNRRASKFNPLKRKFREIESSNKKSPEKKGITPTENGSARKKKRTDQVQQEDSRLTETPAQTNNEDEDNQPTLLYTEDFETKTDEKEREETAPVDYEPTSVYDTAPPTSANTSIDLGNEEKENKNISMDEGAGDADPTLLVEEEEGEEDYLGPTLALDAPVGAKEEEEEEEEELQPTLLIE